MPLQAWRGLAYVFVEAVVPGFSNAGLIENN